MSPGPCPGCGRPIIVERNHHGPRAIVVDLEPSEDGTVVLGIGPFVDAAAAKRAAGAGRPRYRLHACDRHPEGGEGE